MDLRPSVVPQGPAVEAADGPGSDPRPAAAPVAVPMSVAAAMLSISRKHLENNYREWGVPYVRLGSSIRFPVRALNEWIDARTVRAA